MWCVTACACPGVTPKTINLYTGTWYCSYCHLRPCTAGTGEWELGNSLRGHHANTRREQYFILLWITSIDFSLWKEIHLLLFGFKEIVRISVSSTSALFSLRQQHVNLSGKHWLILLRAEFQRALSLGRNTCGTHSLWEGWCWGYIWCNKRQEIGQWNRVGCTASFLGRYQKDQEHWFSAFLRLQPFNTVPDVKTPTIQLFSMQLHCSNFATVVSHNTNICAFQWSEATPVKGPLDPQRGNDPLDENPWPKGLFKKI